MTTRTLRLLASILITLGILTACGGGGDDEQPAAGTQPPTCVANPKACA